MRRRIRRFARPPHRPFFRHCLRRPHRSCLRTFAGHRRGPDGLSQALTAFSRAIRAHRRLATLAPHLFDATEINRLEQRRKADAEWRASWEPALEKVYGPSNQKWPETIYHMPLSPKALRKVEQSYAQWKFGLEAGSLALESYLCRRPFDLIPLSRLARLIDIALTFGRLACGEIPAPDNSHSQALADLKRIYGDRNS
jgi:hypothetical protein